MYVKITLAIIEGQDMYESCTFEAEGSELVLMITDGVSSERAKRTCTLQH